MSYDLGLEGVCTKCGKKERAYYYFADREHRELMTKGRFMLERSNCPSCIISKIFQVARTMKWLRKLSPKEVAKDLEKHIGGVGIDFAQADKTAKEYAKNDKWIDDQAHRVDEYKAWKAKGRTAKVR